MAYFPVFTVTRNMNVCFPDSSVPPTVVVDTVGKLCDIINENVNEQVQQLLGTQDIHRYLGLFHLQQFFKPQAC